MGAEVLNLKELNINKHVGKLKVKRFDSRTTLILDRSTQFNQTIKPTTMTLKLTSLMIAMLLLGCANDTTTKKLKMAEGNPFNVALNEPIKYANVTADHISSYVNVVMGNAAQDISKIIAQENLTFENTFKAQDRISNSLIKASNNVYMLYQTSPDSLIRAAGLKAGEKMGVLFTDIGANRASYKTLQKFADSKEGRALEGLEKELMKKSLDGYKQSGVNLNEKDLATYKRLNKEISGLANQSSTNMNSHEVTLILDEKQANGLSDNFKETYRQADGSYKIPVIQANVKPIMENATSSDIRLAFATKKANIAADKNVTILDSLISKRNQLGKLMGFEAFAGLRLQSNMAKKPKRVWDFLNGLVEAAKPKALKDIEVLKNFRNERMNTPNDTSPIKPWDVSYYKSQLLKTKYNLDNEKMREYFPMEASLDGMLTLYQELLGLEFKKVENPSVWHEDVSMYEVYENGKLTGQFYLDLYPRPNKEAWFYSVPITWGRQFENGYEIPSALLLCNFTKPTDVRPSLLDFTELKTLFHEFGHIANMMAYEGPYTGLYWVKDDFAEGLSQIFENWIDDIDIISAFARHYETGEVFPKEMFDNRLKAKNESSGLNATFWLRKALYDLTIYDKYNPTNPVNTDELWNDIDAKLGIINMHIADTHPQASWTHINGNPVYNYGYIWSEVYAQDMFTEFKKNGLRDTETGIRYRKLILANGDQRDNDEAVEEFLGRPTNNKAYIRSLGLE
jgi:thimet oligopeptidase